MGRKDGRYGAKVTVCAPIDPEMSEQLDRLCVEVNRTRAEIMRGLLCALLVEGKQFVFDEWRRRVNGMGHHVPDGVGKV